MEKRFTFRATEALIKKLLKIAEKRGMTASQLLRKIIKELR